MDVDLFIISAYDKMCDRSINLIKQRRINTFVIFRKRMMLIIYRPGQASCSSIKVNIDDSAMTNDDTFRY